MRREEEPVRILFICSRNQWRSPTAEAIFRNDTRLDARSAGTASSARRRIRAQDVEWADLVLVMEDEHASWLRQRFPQLDREALRVLDIPDEYRFMDEELVEILQAAVEAILRSRTA